MSTETAMCTADGRRFVAMLRDAALQPNQQYRPLHETLAVTLTADGLTVCAGGEDAAVRTACTYTQPRVRSLDVPANRAQTAVFDLTDTLAKYDHLATGLVDMEFSTTAASAVCDECLITGRVGSNGPPFQTALPLTTEGTTTAAWFEASVEPTPTVIETTMDELARLKYLESPVRVRDGELWVDESITPDGRIWGTLETARVDGPDVTAQYPLQPMKRLLQRFEGPIELQAYPDGPLVVTHRQDTATRRYLLQRPSDDSTAV